MTQHVRSKRRILTICQLQGKLAEREYLGAQKHIVNLERARDQLCDFADQMLDTDGETHSAMLAAKMEFGHRLIALGRLQKSRIAKDQKAAETLLSKAHLSKRKTGRAADDLRQATNSCEIRQQQIQPHRTQTPHRKEQ